MNPVPAFPSVADAMAAVQAGLRFLAAADATRMSAQAQAECLQMMERVNASVTAARASVLSAFTSGQGYSADADYSPRAWLIHKTRVTKVVAVAHTAWAKRMVTHPRVMAALAAVVGAVLDALGAPAGAEDSRTHAQRYHDALQEAMRRLLAAGLLPERAGQPVKALVHVSLADLMLIDGSSALLDEWIAGVRAQWAAARAAASQSGSDGGAWLDGNAARSFTCDASVTPMVTGEVNPAALQDLIRLCAELDKRRHAAEAGDPAPDTPAEETLEHAIIGKAVDLLSGPGGLASFLRRRQLGARLGGPSLPLDVGVSADIPAAIRRAVILRDQHCRFPGGCDQPSSGCEVHHLRHRADGGPTSVKDCALFCFFHHQVVIHQWGWTVVLNPDGTTTAWNKDKTKIIHSHSPPARPG